jgi:glycosyltransferase involved in cell wall biosynthesis
MIQSLQSVVVEGWRGINHSFALVNQFQLLEMVKHPELNLSHVDAAFHFAHWSRSTNGAGFHDADEATLSAVPAPTAGLAPDWTYRIFSPVDLRPPLAGGRLAVFLVTELGLDDNSFVDGSDVKQFEAAGNLIVTPSHWSRNRILDWGFQPDTVHVVPHGANANYFFPLPIETVRTQRAALGFTENEVLLLNIGTAIWNKGIDVLLKGFALARQQRKDLRLIFKDQRNTYGIDGDTFVKSTLASAGLLSDDVSNAITLIPANLTMDQMNAMYNIADCYVSPYRAEGFNLPVCEAMACGTPVLVTEGGATDDFVTGEHNRKVSAALLTNVVVQGRQISAYREPDLDHLVNLLINTGSKTSFVKKPVVINWDAPVNQLLALMA